MVWVTLHQTPNDAALARPGQPLDLVQNLGPDHVLGPFDLVGEHGRPFMQKRAFRRSVLCRT